MPVLALQARALGADVSTAAFVVALWPLGMLATSLPAGAVVARLGERTTLLLAGLVDAVAMVAAALATTVWQLGLCVAVSGAAWTAFLIARQGYLIEAVPVHWRARAMSLLGGTFRVGVLVGPLIGALLISMADIRAVFLLSGATSVAAGLLALVMPDLGAESRTAQREAGHVSVRSVLVAHRQTLLTVGVAVIVIGASRSIRASLLPLWADGVGISASTTSLIFAVAALIDVLFFFPGGWLMDRRGRAAGRRTRRPVRRRRLLPAAAHRDRGRGDRGDGADRGGQRARLGDRDDPRRRHRADGRAARSTSAAGASAATSATAEDPCSSAPSPPPRPWPRPAW